jgi:2-C-methyl-D-erythritol 2,4-cyclodiphosphate synthase
MGKKLIIGGVNIDCEFGLKAHSDGDVLIHALADAILGAAGLRDIGYFFPDTSDETLNMDSRIILRRSVELACEHGLSVDYADCTLVAQKPKMAPHIPTMRKNIADSLNIDIDQINIKATTEEGLGFTGEGLGISSQAICLLYK